MDHRRLVQQAFDPDNDTLPLEHLKPLDQQDLRWKETSVNLPLVWGRSGRVRLWVTSVAARAARQARAHLLDSYGHADFVTDPDHYASHAG